MQTGPSVSQAKDWLDQLFLSPGLEKGFTYVCGRYGAVNNHFPVYWAIFGMVTNERTNNQVILEQVDQNEKAVFCNRLKCIF